MAPQCNRIVVVSHCRAFLWMPHPYLVAADEGTAAAAAPAALALTCTELCPLRGGMLTGIADPARHAMPFLRTSWPPSLPGTCRVGRTCCI